MIKVKNNKRGYLLIKLPLFVALTIILSMLISTVIGSRAYAQWGRADGVGYFDGSTDSGESTMTALNSNTCGNLHDEIKENYRNGGNKAKTSAAFIIQTMLWNDGAPGLRSVSSTQMQKWDDLWNGYCTSTNNDYRFSIIDYCRTRTTQYQTNNDDVEQLTAGEVCARTAVFNGNGKMYRIKLDCGQPVGDADHLPEIPSDSSWNMSGASLVDGVTYKEIKTLPATVTFSHTITNDGPNRVTSDWKNWVQNTSNTIGTPPGEQNGPNPFNVNATETRSQTYIIPVGTPTGTLYCQNIKWDHDRGPGTNDESSQACVYISLMRPPTCDILSPITANLYETKTVTFGYLTGTGSSVSLPGNAQYTVTPASGTESSPTQIWGGGVTDWTNFYTNSHKSISITFNQAGTWNVKWRIRDTAQTTMNYDCSGTIVVIAPPELPACRVVNMTVNLNDVSPVEIGYQPSTGSSPGLPGNGQIKKPNNVYINWGTVNTWTQSYANRKYTFVGGGSGVNFNQPGTWTVNWQIKDGTRIVPCSGTIEVIPDEPPPVEANCFIAPPSTAAPGSTISIQINSSGGEARYQPFTGILIVYDPSSTVIYSNADFEYTNGSYTATLTLPNTIGTYRIDGAINYGPIPKGAPYQNLCDSTFIVASTGPTPVCKSVNRTAEVGVQIDPAISIGFDYGPSTATGTYGITGPGGVSSTPPNPITYTEGVSIINATFSNPGVYTITWSASGVVSNCQGTITVTYKPYIKFYGNDVAVGNYFENDPTKPPGCTTDTAAKISTWNKGTSGNYAGSSSQFAASAPNSIDQFSSNQPSAANKTFYVGNLPLTNTQKALTSSNTGNYPATTTFGGLSGLRGRCIPDFYERINSRTATISSYPTNYRFPQTTVTGRDVYKARGDVGITGNFIIDGSNLNWNTRPWPSFTLVVKGNIYIDSSVTRLDGLYIAIPDETTGSGGRIYTCSNANTLTKYTNVSQLYSNCRTRLIVNGAFIAKRVVFGRTQGTLKDSTYNESCSNSTSGSCSSSNNAAEVFMFNPSIYADDPLIDTSSSGSTIDSMTNLPPIL